MGLLSSTCYEAWELNVLSRNKQNSNIKLNFCSRLNSERLPAVALWLSASKEAFCFNA